VSADLPDAVLWDMDGLLVDTEPLWTLAEHDLAARYGARFTAEAKAAIVGTRLDTSVPRLLEHFGVEPTPDEVDRAAAYLLRRMVALFAEPLSPRPGATKLLGGLRARGVPVALVSSSYRVLVDAVLATGVGPFDLTLSGDEVGRAKPHPEPYLTAAAGLGADPTRCVVLEDSPAGADSGLAAGCAVVVVPSVPGTRLTPRSRLTVISSLTQLSVENLAVLVGSRVA
jgi:HAD superfamily hydrolase (TIGR01509 family)